MGDGEIRCATCRFADVVLPASPSLEKEGTFTSTERRIQRLYQVFEPLNGSRPDWIIIQDVANRLGAGWKYGHPSEVMDEIAALTPLFAGVTYSRLDGYNTLQWPVAADGSDQPLLYTKQFAFPDGRARLLPVSWREPQEQPDTQFDLHLNNGRLLEHFHEGNLTYRSPGIHAKTPDTFVEVSPELARERGIESGTLVRLTSRHGNVRVRALVSDRVRDGELYMPMNSSESPVNRLTGSHSDPLTHTPGYKTSDGSITEADFQNATLGKSELASLQEQCTDIVENGSGTGICTGPYPNSSTVCDFTKAP